jgi:hypothetical protein
MLANSNKNKIKNLQPPENSSEIENGVTAGNNIVMPSLSECPPSPILQGHC